MARVSNLDLYDRLLGGNLRPLIMGWRAENVPIDEVAIRLRDHGVRVSRSTVGRWVKQFETEAGAAA